MKRSLSLFLILLLLLVGCRQPKVTADPATLYHGALEPDKVDLVFLSVGQGDACLMAFPTGERVMINTGPFESRDHLVDQLHALGVDKLDAVYVTHGHADHTGNLLTLVRRFDVPRVYYGGSESDYGDLLKKVRRRGVSCTPLQAGNNVSYGEAVLTVLSPLTDRVYDDENDRSAVLRPEAERRLERVEIVRVHFRGHTAALQHAGLLVHLHLIGGRYLLDAYKDFHFVSPGSVFLCFIYRIIP